MGSTTRKFGQGLLAAGISLLLSSAAIAGVQDFTLHNETGVEIHEVYVAPSKSDDWEEDILGDDTLADGESVDITFNDRQKVSKWDIMIKDEDGNSIEWGGLDLTEIASVTLHYKKGKAWADVE
jgi:hypothetical protein